MTRRNLRWLCSIGLKRLIRGVVPQDSKWKLTFAHPHLSTTLLDDAHNPRMRNSGSHGITGVVDFLMTNLASIKREGERKLYFELLEISGFIVHLDFEGINLEQLRPTL